MPHFWASAPDQSAFITWLLPQHHNISDFVVEEKNTKQKKETVIKVFLIKLTLKQTCKEYGDGDAVEFSISQEKE